MTHEVTTTMNRVRDIVLTTVLLLILISMSYLIGYQHALRSPRLDTGYAAGYVAGHKTLLDQLRQFDEFGATFLDKGWRTVSL
jgi:hypothetical protein